jgi:hypothetical protein
MAAIGDVVVNVRGWEWEEKYAAAASASLPEHRKQKIQAVPKDFRM